jgi:GNAT superfamily N-acetyltransferase
MIKLKQLILENEKEMGLNIISNPELVSIYMKLPDGRSATASIDKIGGNMWWVSRVIVGPPQGNVPYEFRNKGIGSMLIRRAVQEVLKHDPNAEIIVEPGGSYGSKEEDQLRFYRKNGFVDFPGGKGVMIYTKKPIDRFNIP